MGLRGADSGAVRCGLVLALVVAFLSIGQAYADDPGKPSVSEGSWSSDPTVGTLPMFGEAGSPDQAIALRGTPQAIRAALLSATPAGDGDVAAWMEPIELGDGTVWVRLYGDVELQLDVNHLLGIEITVFSGFEGGGMAYVAETPGGLVRGDDLHAGEEVQIDAQRLLAAGVMDPAVRMHCVHATGQRSTVGLIWAPEDAALVIRQDV